MAVQYDESIIQEHAQSLYDKASGVVFLWTAFVGAIAGISAVAYLFPTFPTGHPARMAAIVAGIVGMMIGHSIGSTRAFALRLQAQIALCQAAIERNTRKEKEPHGAALYAVTERPSGASSDAS